MLGLLSPVTCVVKQCVDAVQCRPYECIVSFGQRTRRQRLSRRLSVMAAHRNCHLHPSFQSKPVYELRCCLCDNLVCARGMKAILLADRNVELYSTDLPPPGSVQLVGKHYETNNCQCRIGDVACSVCGNTVGYHVALPCQSCLTSCNNGHFWMYHSNQIRAEKRLNSSGEEILVWAQVPSCSDDELLQQHHTQHSEQHCKSSVRWIECYR